MPLTSADIGIYPVASATSAAFTSAVNAAIANVGGIIVLPPATITGYWDFSDTDVPLTIVGTPGLSVLKWPDHTTNTGATRTGDYGKTSNVLLKLGSNSTVLDITLDGNKANQTPATTSEGCNGLVWCAKSNIKARNVEVRNMVHASIVIMNSSDYELNGCYCHDSYVLDQTIWPNWTYEHPVGIYLAYDGVSFGHRGKIINCRCINHGLDGLQANGQTDLQIIGGEFNYCGLGMEHWNGNNPWTGNTVGACGIYVPDSQNVTIMGVTTSHNTEAGINITAQGVQTSQTVKVIGCISESNADAGFLISSTIDSELTGNTARNNGSAGTEYARSAGYYLSGVTDCNVFHNRSYGQLYGLTTAGTNVNIQCAKNTLKSWTTSAFNGTTYSDNVTA